MTQIEREQADAYKIGFLTKLARMGVLPSEFAKRASVGLVTLMEGANLAGSIGKLGLQGAALAPIALGATTGAFEGLTDAPSNEDIEMLRKRETLELYKRLAKEVNLRRVMRDHNII